MYTISTDSESQVHVPCTIDYNYTTASDAYSAASEYVHQFDGLKLAVFHIEDMDTDETVDTVESLMPGINC